MKKYNTLCFAVFLGLAILAAPLTVSAECIDVTPANWDYGDVEVGVNETQIFTLNSCADTEVYVSVIEITDDATGAYTLSLAPSTPLFIPGGAFEEVEVTFSPTNLGAHEAFLHIRSDAPEGHTYINLYGMGVSDEPEPGEAMADLIDFVATSVDAGSLTGDGPGGSASGRLKAFQNMLNAANDLIEDGEYALACEQLQDTKDRADGVHPPPDFVTGLARAEVEAMIIEVMAELGCP